MSARIADKIPPPTFAKGCGTKLENILAPTEKAPASIKGLAVSATYPATFSAGSSFKIVASVDPGRYQLSPTSTNFSPSISREIGIHIFADGTQRWGSPL